MINPETVSAEVMATAESIRSEYVVEVTGLVEAREQANPNLPTGAVELKVEAIRFSILPKLHHLKSRTELKPMMIPVFVTAT